MSVFGVVSESLNTERFSVFSPNPRKCGKNADQNNAEYGHFLPSEKHGNVTSVYFDYAKNTCKT